MAQSLKSLTEAVAETWRVLSGSFGPKREWPEGLTEVGLRPEGSTLVGSFGAYSVTVYKPEEPRILITSVDPGFTVVRQHHIGRYDLDAMVTGDSEFDYDVFLGGNPGYAMVMLDPDIRARVHWLIRDCRGSLEGGHLEAYPPRPEDIGETLQRMLRLAKDLEHRRDHGLLVRLQRLLVSPPNFAPKALQALRHEFVRSGGRAPDLSGFTGVPHTHALLLETAVLVLTFEDGKKLALEAFRRVVDDEFAPVPARGLALNLLVDALDRPAARDVLSAKLEPSVIEIGLRRAAIDACVRLKLLAPLLDGEPQHAAERLHWLRALVELGDPAAQPRLIEGLLAPEADARAAAAEALGRLGDLDALDPLVAALEAAGDGPRRLRSAFERAIGDIQDRAGVAQAGEVSIVALTPMEGALSSAAASAGGEVSFPEDGDAPGTPSDRRRSAG
ncbi:MAG: HEAT repeat domain-containing protein [Acidobacteriota bacterium]